MLKPRARQILKHAVESTLKPSGFKKRGDVYVRDLGSVLHLVDVQYSRWNDAKEISFTLNIGLYVRGVTSIFRGRPEPKVPGPTDCCASVRVGMLKDSRLDIWWKVTAEDGPDAETTITEDMASVVKKSVLPFLARFEDARAVAEFLSKARAPADEQVEPQAEGLRLAYAAIIWRTLGIRELCAQCLNGAVRQSKRTPLEEVLGSFAGRFAC